MANIVACILFQHLNLMPIEEVIVLSSGSLSSRPSWLATELNELLGILVLDVSMIDIGSHKVLIAELLGFFLLIIAAMVDYYISPGHWRPIYILRKDLKSITDAMGLFMLSLVSIAHYRARQHRSKRKMELKSAQLV